MLSKYWQSVQLFQCLELAGLPCGMALLAAPRLDMHRDATPWHKFGGPKPWAGVPTPSG